VGCRYSLKLIMDFIWGLFKKDGSVVAGTMYFKNKKSILDGKLIGIS